MSLEEFADIEVADALERQAKDKVQEEEKANEDPDDEDVLEVQRQKDAAMDDWKDYVPKGRGNTKRIWVSSILFLPVCFKLHAWQAGWMDCLSQMTAIWPAGTKPFCTFPHIKVINSIS